MASPASSFEQPSFLGGEWSPVAQGRIDQPTYKIAMNTCLNGMPVEEGNWNRRSGTAEFGITHFMYNGVCKEFTLPDGSSATVEVTYGGGAAQLRIWAKPYNSIGTGVALVGVGTATISSITTANPAVVVTTAPPSPAWSTGDTAVINMDTSLAGSNAPTLQNRQFQITKIDTTHYSLADIFLGGNVDGSALGFVSAGTSYISKVNVLSLPYTSLAIVKQLRIIQADNVLYLLAPGFTTYVLTLTPNYTGLDLTGITFALTSIDYSTTDGPYLDAPIGASQTSNGLGYVVKGADWNHLTFVVTDGTYTFAATDVGKGIRLWAQPPPYAAAHSYAVGNVVTYNGALWSAAVASATLTTAVAPGSTGVTSSGQVWQAWAPAPQAGGWVYGAISAYTNSSTVSVVLAGVAADHQTLFQANGSFDSRDAAYYTDGGATVTNTTGSMIDIFRIGAFGNGVFPTCGTFHEGRVWLGGAIANRFDGSQSGLPAGSPIMFAPTDKYGAVLDTSAIDETVSGSNQNMIRWIAPDEQGLIMGTIGGEFIVTASALNDPITPTSIQSHRATKYKCAAIEPVRVGHALIFIQQFRRKVIEYVANVFGVGNKFVGRHLNEFAKHLSTAGLNDISYQEELSPCLWTFDDNGILVGCTYRRISNFPTEAPVFTAWHHHLHGGGRLVQSLCRGSGIVDATDSVVLLTKDTATGYCFVEAISQLFDENQPITKAWYVDAVPIGRGGTDNPTNTAPGTPGGIPNTSGGKFYFEIKINQTATNNGYVQFGVCNASASTTKWFRDANSAVQNFNGGNVYIAGADHGTDLTIKNDNDYFGICVDTINNLLWFKNLTRDASWGGGDGSDPNTNTGGWDISGVSGPLYICFGAVGRAGSDQVTLNTGGQAFNGTLPTGASAWDAGGTTGWNFQSAGYLHFIDTTFGSGSEIVQTVAVSNGSLTATVTTTNYSGSNVGYTWGGAGSTHYDAGDTVSYYQLTYAAGVFYATVDKHSPPYSSPPVDIQWQYNVVGIRTNTYKNRT